MKILEDALTLGTAVSSQCDDRGMASVGLLFNPYKCRWEATCSWSDSSSIVYADEDIIIAVSALNRLLRAEYDKCKAAREDKRKGVR